MVGSCYPALVLRPMCITKGWGRGMVLDIWPRYLDQGLGPGHGNGRMCHGSSWCGVDSAIILHRDILQAGSPPRVSESVAKWPQRGEAQNILQGTI